MSRARGNALPNHVAAYLRFWWPFAEAVGSGRNGRDITGTPGVAFEVKTADDFKRDFKPTIWVTQARSNASDDEPSPTIYFPRGLGAANVGNALSIQPLHWEMRLLEEAGYTPRLSREAS